MKRSLVFVLVLSLIFLIFCTSCSCGDDGSDSRGCGYVCYRKLAGCFDCAVGDSTNSGQDSLSKHYLAVEGEDYSKPSLTYNAGEQSCVIEFSMRVYEEFDLNMEICVVQNGVLLGSYKYSRTCDSDVQLTKEIYYRNYKADGGEVYCFINRFEASMEE